jgi:hypothetical protein
MKDEGSRMKKKVWQTCRRASRSAIRFLILILLPSSFILLCGIGCAALAVAGRAVPQYKPAAYSGLAGQSAAVMVWADRGVRIDWPSVQLDLATLVQNNLQKSTAPELKGTTWPWQPASVVRYQRDHPGIEAMSITEVAPKIGVSRLIYIEVESLSTRSDASLQMFRGSATATLKVIEIADGHADIAYTESGIRTFFPPKSPPEGILNSNDQVMYRGTMVTLSEELASKLATQMEEP